MTVILPYDVWRHITSFLSPDEVKKLYPLNSALLSIAMEERYKTAFVGDSMLHAGTHRSLTRLILPELAARVRTFTFHPANIFAMLLESKLKQYVGRFAFLYTNLWMTIAESSSPASSGPVRKERMMPVQMAMKNIVKIMGQMISLRSLKVQILSNDDHRWFNDRRIPSFFDPGWPAFGASLREIELDIPLENMAWVLPVESRVTLPNLESLTMSIRKASGSQEASELILIGIILPFIDLHRHTLQRLAFNIGCDMNFSSLLLNIKHIATLSSFQIKLLTPSVSGQGWTETTSLHHFLQTHRSHLTSLTVVTGHYYYPPHSPPPGVSSQDLFSVDLPRLQSLSLHLNNFPTPYKAGTIPYIQRFKASLVSLDLQQNFPCWTVEDLQLLFREFGPNHSLRALKIRVKVFGAALLIVLAANLPDLRTLDLEFVDLGPAGYSIGTQTIQTQTPLFCVAMYNASFPEWRLQTLNIKPELHVHVMPAGECKAALVNALPNVETFCGLDREDYVSFKYCI